MACYNLVRQLSGDRLGGMIHVVQPLALTNDAARSIASAKVRKSTSPHRNSGRNSASAARCLMFISLRNLECFCVSVLPDNLGGAELRPPRQTKEPAGLRPPRQRRSCGTSSWQRQRFQPEELGRLAPRGSLSPPGTFRGCKPEHSRRCPTN